MFIDRIRVRAAAGKGGNGAVAWSRAKYIPKGGPAGGDGGKGGSIIFQADPQISSLEWYKFHGIVKADNGQPGSNKSQRGKNGANLLLKVPCGTVIKDAATDEILCDMVEAGQKWVACQGGEGGRGNESFKSPTNQAPLEFTFGDAGEEKYLELELKIIADVGLVGFPNAGKSTLLSQMAQIDVKVAAYPFTTLSPNLGFVQFEDYSRIYFADIPGIIEDAHKNKGLGLEFLRHIERTQCLLYVLDADVCEDRNPWDDFCALRNELKEYNPKLLEKKFLVALNKIDLEAAKEGIKIFRENFSLSAPVIEISAQENVGLGQLKKEIYQLVTRLKK